MHLYMCVLYDVPLPQFLPESILPKVYLPTPKHVNPPVVTIPMPPPVTNVVYSPPVVVSPSTSNIAIINQTRPKESIAMDEFNGYQTLRSWNPSKGACQAIICMVVLIVVALGGIIAGVVLLSGIVCTFTMLIVCRKCCI